jgi:GNAT superfamily N-acetyltransferase
VVIVGIAEAPELASVRHFYRRVGYAGGVRSTDTVLVARDGASIVGAVRLCPEEHCLVLRGMYVSRARRGAGVGGALLDAASAIIGERRCWCIPFAHLRTFYGRAGFSKAGLTETPPFLAARSARYSARGHAVVIMKRPAGWRPSGAR